MGERRVSSSSSIAAPSTWRTRASLLKQFVSQPFVIGAVAPSSRHLAAKMVEGLDLGGARSVVEFGPGTGVFTDAVLPRLGPQTKFVAIELNQRMAAVFRERHPGVALVNDSVEHVRRICDEHAMGDVDYIISGLPWASFPDDLQDRILRGVLATLRPGGQLVTFGYHIGTWLKAGKSFYGKLPGLFAKVERSNAVWRNIPPAFVVRCTKG